jgi:phenylalanyl-tRNA synthetase alpha subunit
MLDKLNEIEKSALESLSASRTRPLWRHGAWQTWAQFAADAGLCRVWETLKGRATSCRRGGEPCEGGVRVRFGGTCRGVKEAALAKSLEEEKLDVTLPGRGEPCGRLHPSTQQLRRVLEHSRGDGFSGVHLARGGDG